MKIGFDTKDYQSFVGFDIPDDMENKEIFMVTLISLCRAIPKDELDIIIQINKGVTKE